MPDQTSRFPWIALAAGLLIGLVAGLLYAWVFNPVEYTDVSPDRLNADDQQAYVLLVAEAYMQDRDVERARRRLERLDLGSATDLAAAEADDALLRGEDPMRVQALATLAEALGAAPLAADVFSGTAVPTATPGTPEPTPTDTLEPVIPTDSPTLTPTLVIPTTTPDLFPQTELGLLDRQITCEGGNAAGRIEVTVRGDDGQGIPAVEVVVAWAGGEEHFFTGLKPEIGPGYADFQMAENQLYTLTLVDRAAPVSGIDSTPCTTEAGGTSLPTYRLTFTPTGDGAP